MTTKSVRPAHTSVPKDVRSVLLAFSVLMERIDVLPSQDRDELFELLQEWRKIDDREEKESIERAMEEILAQRPLAVREMPIVSKTMPGGLKTWTRHIAQKIRGLRESRGLTQAELAVAAGLPQSHISRLENAEHSATHKTLKKIAQALKVRVGKIDPCIED